MEKDGNLDRCKKNAQLLWILRDINETALDFIDKLEEHGKDSS